MSRYRSVIALFAALLALVLVPTLALAHERREVGNYLFVVAFLNEPAFQEEQNRMSVRITNKDTEQPVEKLE